jgi:RNA polymerase sigma factor (sigma-70 family)
MRERGVADLALAPFLPPRPGTDAICRIGATNAEEETRTLSFAGQAVGHPEEIVRAGLPELLARLWRYGLVLSRDRSTAEDLVQAACVRALERAQQFTPGTRLDRWVFAILRSIWLNELRSRRVREGAGQVDAVDVLVFEGAHEIEQNILAAQVFREVEGLPEPQREAVFLVYGEGLSYREAADLLRIPAGTVMSRLAAARAKLSRLGDDGEGGEESGAAET